MFESSEYVARLGDWVYTAAYAASPSTTSRATLPGRPSWLHIAARKKETFTFHFAINEVFVFVYFCTLRIGGPDRVGFF